jgi:CubicO group peptidase (beta-lactamase class C family)
MSPLPRTLAPAALALACSLLAAPGARADDAALRAAVEQRLLGDRTGACFAVAVVEQTISRAFVCADGGDPARRIGPGRAFEIGSVSKTMLATVLADLIEQGKASLDDPLAAYLPEGTAVPTFEGQPIRLRHLVTHTSGLPAIPAVVMAGNPGNPYAAVDADALLRSLAGTTLTRAPGATFEYSNFGAMLLSLAVSRREGVDFETLLQQRLFAPLGMQGAYVNRPPSGAQPVQGRSPNGVDVPAWTFQTDLAGVGGVRATLEDMVRYVQAEAGLVDTPLAPVITRTHAPVETPAAAPIAMHWMRATLNGRDLLAHEGGTGGFSSFVAFDPVAKRGVVILSDTAVHSLGGLGSLGRHLLDPTVPNGKPRRLATPPVELRDALVGEYQLANGMRMTLRAKGDSLEVQVPGQPAFAMAYDDAGEFFPQALDAILAPQRRADGRMGFTWRQGGGAIPATRIGGDAPVAAAATAIDPARLRDYAGDYTLRPGFVLAVRADGGVLTAQATGQGAFPLQPAGADVFEAPAFGIVIRFTRNEAGAVTSLALEQGGATLRGTRD